MQLRIESFLIETLIPQRVKVKIRRAVRKVREIISRQLEFNFNPPPSGLYEVFYQGGVKKYRVISFSDNKTGKVGSPKKMRKIIKDEPYLAGI